MCRYIRRHYGDKQKPWRDKKLHFITSHKRNDTLYIGIVNVINFYFGKRIKKKFQTNNWEEHKKRKQQILNI
jgi:hypothetical protein